MKPLNNLNSNRPPLPIKIAQFGEGNFLRAFVDWFIDQLNEKTNYNSGVAIIQPLAFGMVDKLDQQDGLYHHVMQGLNGQDIVDEARLITCVQKTINPFEASESYFDLAKNADLKIVFSNTTEAGIVFDSADIPNDGDLAKTFPGKLTQLLTARFEALGGTPDAALAIIPCELIESNGDKLKSCIAQYCTLWNLSEDFQAWVKAHVHFANTLVDRIVPGYPKDEIKEITNRIGFEDNLVVKSESFHLFVIEGDAFIQEHFPAHKYGFNVKYVDSITPYRTQKVRILNGAHTSMVPIGLLSGIETVKETIDHETVGKFISSAIFEEIVATIDIPGEDPREFATEIITRFKNPFIRHELKSIALNSISKFKVRVLPTILDYFKIKGSLPDKLTYAMASLIALYLSEDFEANDNPEYLEFFAQLKSNVPTSLDLAKAVLANTDFWDQDLTEVTGLVEKITADLTKIKKEAAIAL